MANKEGFEQCYSLLWIRLSQHCSFMAPSKCNQGEDQGLQKVVKVTHSRDLSQLLTGSCIATSAPNTDLTTDWMPCHCFQLE